MPGHCAGGPPARREMPLEGEPPARVGSLATDGSVSTLPSIRTGSHPRFSRLGSYPRGFFVTKLATIESSPLHAALLTQNWAEWDESLVTKQSCTEQEGRPLALHLALHLGAPVHVLDTIVAENPHAVLADYAGVTSAGSTALHVAAGCSAPVEVFRLLLTSCPQVIVVKNSDGQLAVDLIDKGDAWRKWCRWQYNQLPQDLDSQGSSPGQLEAAWQIDGHDERSAKGYVYWTANERGTIMQYLMSRLKRYYRDLDKQTSDPMQPQLIVHIAIKHGTTVEALKMLLDENREAVRTPNHWGDLPLHTAVLDLDARQQHRYLNPVEIVMHKTREAVACLLLEEYKDACTHKNVFGDLPLHLLFRQNEKVRAHFDDHKGQSSSRMGVVFKGRDSGGNLIDQWPYIFKIERDSPAAAISGLKEGQKLVAIGNEPVGDRAFDDVKHLVSARPVTLWFSSSGSHATVTTKFPVAELVEKVVKAHPDACKTKGAFGDLPLHLAVQTGGDGFGCVRTLVQTYPEAAQEKNEVGDVPLRVAVNYFNNDRQIQQLARYENEIRCTFEDEARDELQTQIGCKLSRLQTRLLKALTRYRCHPDQIIHFVDKDAIVDFLVEDFISDSPNSGAVHLQSWQETMQQLVREGPDAWGTSTGKASPRDLLLACDLLSMRMWAKTSGAYLNRYIIEPSAVHRTATSVVLFAQDMKKHRMEVALKFVREPEHFAAEIFGRFSNGRNPNDLDAVVIRIIAWHIPHRDSSRELYNQLRDLDNGEGQKLVGSKMMIPDFHQPIVIGGLDNLDSQAFRGRLAENTGTDYELDGGLAPFDQYKEYPYVLVLARGDKSLHDVCAKEYVAGHNMAQIRDIVRGVSTCLAELHSFDIVHGDVKQRNILRTSGKHHANRWILCDMDASAHVGGAIGAKSSSAYWPPELARVRFSSSEEALDAVTAFDIWSLGVIIFEMCAGRSLFGQDTANDQLVNEDDKVRLCTWYTISDHELDAVSMSVGTDAEVEAARNLIRWCLKGDPDNRPTAGEVLSHPFLNPSATLEERPMEYHGFISHAQADASSTAMNMFMLYGQFGLHTWVDMRQELLTLDGMRRGVRRSAVFILILTEHVLESWYCCQEMLCAIEAKKPVQLVLEEEKRFHPFDLKGWTQSKAPLGSIDKDNIVDQTMKWQVDVGQEKLVSLIENIIDDNLSKAVVYRRRAFEVDAMMRELCVRAPVKPPIILPVEQRPTIKRRVSVLVIHNTQSQTACEMVADMKEGLLHNYAIDFCTEKEIHKATRVLLILTKGVLTPPALTLLERVLEHDKLTHADRLVCVYNEHAGWQFKHNVEKQSAPKHVQLAIDAHEALAYRPKTDDMTRHEFPALLTELAKRLGM